MFSLRLSFCKGRKTNGYYVRITNQTDLEMCLGPVMVFNSRTISVLNTGMCYVQPGKFSICFIMQKPEITSNNSAGEKFKLMIPNGLLGVCQWNTFLLPFTTETDSQLTWEYHRLLNNSCGYNSR